MSLEVCHPQPLIHQSIGHPPWFMAEKRKARKIAEFTMTELFRRRNLPHWDVPGGTYFVTSCLAGSIPAQGLLRIDRFRKKLDRQVRPPGTSEVSWKDMKWKKTFKLVEGYLDHAPAVRHLADERLATVVRDAMLHFAGERYQLLSYSVMPSHIHWVFRPLDCWTRTWDWVKTRKSPRERIMHSLKGFTARRCNRILGREGVFWQSESYDRVVRDEEELTRICEYVEANPVKAGLVQNRADWPFSSAFDRVT
jgi:putative transposase